MIRILLNAAALCFVAALFTPVTVDVSWKPHPVYEFEVREIKEYGIVSGIYYLNLAFQLIPLLIAYYARRIVLSQIFIVISTLLIIFIPLLPENSPRSIGADLSMGISDSEHSF